MLHKQLFRIHDNRIIVFLQTNFCFRQIIFLPGAVEATRKNSVLALKGNQNIIMKWSLSILKMIEVMKLGLSIKKKRFAISLRSIQYLEEVLSF